MTTEAAVRLRLVGWNVQPVLMVDDGENLTPLEVQAQSIPAAGWQAFKDGGDELALNQLRAQVEAHDTKDVPSDV